jgi:small-conductance mechanosensitive channel
LLLLGAGLLLGASLAASAQEQVPPLVEDADALTGQTPQTPAGDAGPNDPAVTDNLDRVVVEIREGDWSGAAEAFWNARLFHAGDTAIHINQLIIALLVLIIGVLISRRIARIARGRLIKFKRVDAHAAALIQRLLYYLLVTIVVLVALPIAGIPITIFTVLGGAVAIGVGFGAQNLFNNLISSLIIMVEKPIRIGDIIEIGSVDEGRVEDIGNRCTRIRRSDGMDVLIPNSHFLENPVVNWTLFDIHVRGSVDVGVAYGSPTTQVRDLIMQAASEHPKVLKSPAPIVLFESFGDNSLAFKLMFWADITAPMQLRMICSDLRYKIDGLFREADITISFPQRDVHLDSLSPIEVKMVSGDADGDARS